MYAVDGSRKIFPLRLHELLSEAKAQGVSDIISWHPSGAKFIIHKPKELESKVLATFFNQSKIASFKRQLNAYGFKRESLPNKQEGVGAMLFSHEGFLRDDPSCCERITRKNYSPMQSANVIGIDRGTYFRPESEQDLSPLPLTEDFSQQQSADPLSLEDNEEGSTPRGMVSSLLLDSDRLNFDADRNLRQPRTNFSDQPRGEYAKPRRAKSLSPVSGQPQMQHRMPHKLHEDVFQTPSHAPVSSDDILDELVTTVDRNTPLREFGDEDMAIWDATIESLSSNSKNNASFSSSS